MRRTRDRGPKGYGNAGVSLFDAPGQKTWEFALFKFAAPSRTLGAADFGRINGTVVNNREMQLGLKYLF